MDTALTLGALVAFLAALTGDRTACALLGSLGASFLITSSLGLWMLDLAVLAVILRPGMSMADELIAALFLIAWPFYLASDGLRYDASYAVVLLQLLLTAPITRIRKEAVIFAEFAADVSAFIRSRFLRSIPLLQRAG
jgi:hypothetical protein